MDDQLLQKILENTFTLSQLRHRVRILHEYLSQQMFAKEEPLQQEPDDLAWLNSLGNQFFSQFNRNNIDQTFQKLDSYIKNTKPLIIYLAFSANEEAIAQIGQTLRKTFTNHKIFDLRINPRLIAGCALSLNGQYKDYSLKSKIEGQREKILESFKKFLS